MPDSTVPPVTAPTHDKPRTESVPSRPSLIRTSLLAVYEKQIKFLEKVAAGEPFEIRTHVTVTAGGKARTKGKAPTRAISTKSQTIAIFTPTLDERMRAMEHLARFGLGAPNVNLDKDGDNAKSVVITERAE